MLPSKWTACVCLLLLPVGGGFAQAVSGNIDGTVVDSSGGAVPDATITITDLERGTATHKQSNAQGNFSQTHLLAGSYRVKVESPGFAPFFANATVQVDATTRVDASLYPASDRTGVNVTTDTPLLTADRAEIALTFTGSEVKKLPLLIAIRPIFCWLCLARRLIRGNFQSARTRSRVCRRTSTASSSQPTDS
jgi:hypothetical protein